MPMQRFAAAPMDFISNQQPKLIERGETPEETKLNTTEQFPFTESWHNQAEESNLFDETVQNIRVKNAISTGGGDAFVAC